MKILSPILIILISACLNIQASYSLSTDRDQEAEIVADEVEIDTRTGKRIFIGNVKILQGSLKIKADKLVVNMTDSKLVNATAYGNPAKFRQRPDGQSRDDEGEGREIFINGADNSIDLRRNAKLRNAQQYAKGNHIYYNRSSGKLKIKGLRNKKKKSKIDQDDFFTSNNSRSSAPVVRKSKPKATQAAKQPSISSAIQKNVDWDSIPTYGAAPAAATSSNEVAAEPVNTTNYNDAPVEDYQDPVIDRGESLPEKLVLPKKTQSSSSSNRSRLIILPR